MGQHNGSQPWPGQRVQVFSGWRQAEVVLRLLRIKDLELPSGKLGATAARLSKWRGQFLTAGRTVLKQRPSTPDTRIQLFLNHNNNINVIKVLLKNQI